MQAVITWFSGKPEFLSAKNMPSAESNCLTYLDSCLLKGFFFKVKLAFCFCDKVPANLSIFLRSRGFFSFFQVPKPCPNLSSNQPDAVKESNKSTGRNFLLKNHQLRLFGAPLILNVEPEKPSQMKKKRGSGFGQRRFRKCYAAMSQLHQSRWDSLAVCCIPKFQLQNPRILPNHFPVTRKILQSGHLRWPERWS